MPIQKSSLDASKLLKPGDRVGALYVINCGVDTIEFRARKATILMWILATMLTGPIAAFGWYGVITSRPGEYNMEFLLALTAVAGTCLVLAISHLGLSLTVDGRKKMISRGRLISAFNREWPTDELRTIKIELLNLGKANADSCKLTFIDQEGKENPFITKRRIDKRDSANLVLAARQMGRLLGVSTEIRGTTKKGCNEFTMAINELHASLHSK